MENNSNQAVNGSLQRDNSQDGHYLTASVRPKIPEKPKSLSLARQNAETSRTAQPPREVTPSNSGGGSSLVKVFDTATTDDLYDDLDDEFGFFSKGSPDTVTTVTIKFSSDEKGVVTETKTADKPVVRPKESKHRQKLTNENLLVRHNNNSADNGAAVIDSAYEAHNKVSLQPVPPPRNKKHQRTDTPVAEDLLGVGTHTPAIAWNNSDTPPRYISSVTGTVTPDKSDSLPSIPPRNYTNKAKEQARITISKKLKDIVTPKTSTKIVYDRSALSPVTGTPIEVDRSGITNQDEGEDFVQYLKGLKTEISPSSSDSEGNDEHILYARSRNNIGGSGENGFHLDDVLKADDHDNASDINLNNLDTADVNNLDLEFDFEAPYSEDQQKVDVSDSYENVPKKEDYDEDDGEESEDDDDNKNNDSDKENDDEEDSEGEKDEDDDNDDCDDDENDADDDSEADDDQDHNPDGEQDNANYSDGSYTDDFSESSDAPDGDDSVFTFSPGLRSRGCVVLTCIGGVQDVKSPVEAENLENGNAAYGICSDIVSELICNAVDLSVSTANLDSIICSETETTTGSGVLNQDNIPDCSTYTVEHKGGDSLCVNKNMPEFKEIIGSLNGDNLYDQKTQNDGNLCQLGIKSNISDTSCDSQIVAEKTMTSSDENIYPFDDAGTEKSNLNMKSKDEIKDTVTFTKSEMTVRDDSTETAKEATLDSNIRAGDTETVLSYDDSASDSFSETENVSEFESALEDDFGETTAGSEQNINDYWSVSLENALGSETDLEESSDFESLSDDDLIVSETNVQISDDIKVVRDTYSDNNLILDIKLHQNDYVGNDTDDCNETLGQVNGNLKSSLKHMETNNINKIEADNVIEIDIVGGSDSSDDESIFEANNNSNDPTSRIPNENMACCDKTCLDSKGFHRTLTTTDPSVDDLYHPPFSNISGCENSADTAICIIKEDKVKQTESPTDYVSDIAPEQLFDDNLNAVFEQVSELIDSMEHRFEPNDKVSANAKTDKDIVSEEDIASSKDYQIPTHSYMEASQLNSGEEHIKDLLGSKVSRPNEQIEKDKCHHQITPNLKAFEEPKGLSVSKTNAPQKLQLKTTTVGKYSNKEQQDIPKYRNITYTIPYLKSEVKKKLSPAEERSHMMLCKKKMSLLNGQKRVENARQNKLRKSRLAGNKESVSEYKTNVDTVKKKQGPRANTIKVGSGFVILGAGELLNIPESPKLTEFRKIDNRCQGQPCKYFRGIPGVINNAYKMSNIFPKVHPPTSAAPQHILHACNRLVTPVPTSTPSPSKEERYGMMLEAAAFEAESNKTSDNSDLTEILNNARDCLNCSRFDDAEAAFLKLYQQIQERPEDSGKLLVETLTGLADICIRRSRMCRSNPLEWQWLCMHAIALLQYTVEFCESELEDEQDNKLSEWFQEQKQASELKCRPLDDAFIRSLYNSLKHNANFFDPFQSFSLPTTPVHSNRKTNLFPLSSNMPQYLVIPGMRYRVTDHGLQKQSSDDTNLAVDWLAKFQHYCKDRLQTKDSKECTEKILKSNENKTDDDDDTESVVSHGSNGSLDWDNGDLQGNNAEPQIPGIEEVNEDLLEDDSPVKDYSLAFELASVDSDNDGWDFFLDKRQNCNFQTVVQVSNGDNGRDEKEEEEKVETTKEIEDVRQHEKRTTKLIFKDMISPLHEHSISLTLSRSFCRLADKLVQEEEYKKAEAVYDKILDIIDTIQDGTAGMLKFSARIMKNLGTVKSKLGKSSSGLALLNKALQTYRDLQDEEANFEIAISLIELGNGYIVGKNHEDSVFEDVIIAICDFFEKDSGDPQSASTSSCGSTSVMTSSLRSDNEERNVEEAVMCYSEAISLLDRYTADERQTEMFAKAVMRLGDCFFMQNDYDRALDCYERALGMFRSSNIYGKDSLMENAHVLCMLGVSSFMLHVYPRAASVFEMALHMVKCAYGFRRTFLNGMLQSLAGITYYKMKNYHKCVSMCYQSFETYCDIFGEELSRLNKQKFWLVCQTLYVMGNSYNILSLYQKSIKYLTIARSLMKSSRSRERRQFMRVLQILGDSYFAQYDYKTALTFYNEALEYGECESTISFDEVFDPNCASDEMAIHNRLVSKSAEAHLNMQQYQNAVHYLEQAHDIQEVMGEDIKEDLINTLNQLGEMHSLAGDIDKAIESYKESLDVFREIHHGELGPDMCTTLGNLAAICYVKACLSDEIEEELEMIAQAEQYFQEALKLDSDDGVCVKYANFLYSQAHYEEAINDLNNALQFEDHMQMSDIVYTGLEKITLPDLLQDEVDTQEEICLPSACLARYLLILCHKALGQTLEAESNLIGLMEDVTDYDIPLLHSLLGYAMMELSLFEEAAICFHKAFETEEDYILASENYCICVIIILLKTLQDAVLNIWEYHLPKQKRCLK